MQKTSMEPTMTLSKEKMSRLSKRENEALQRLIGHAKRDSGQSGMVADFLLAWWNSPECGAFDLINTWGCDDVIAEDMITIFAFVARNKAYPDNLGFGADFSLLVRMWRPALFSRPGNDVHPG